MDTCILKLRPTNEHAGKVVQNPLNKRVILQDDPPALAFHLDKAGDFHFGRAESSDVVLTHQKCSAKHGFISVNDKGTPTFHDTSLNGTTIGEEVLKTKAVKLEDGTLIAIANASFNIELPQRGAHHQQQYEHNAEQATLSSAQKALEALPLTSGSTNTVLLETVGPYNTISTLLDRSMGVRREVAKKQSSCSLFVLKRFDTDKRGLASRERRAWNVIQGSKRQHVSFNDFAGLIAWLTMTEAKYGHAGGNPFIERQSHRRCHSFSTFGGRSRILREGNPYPKQGRGLYHGATARGVEIST